MTDKPVVRVGMGVIVVKEKKMLCGRRKGSHAEGLISWPGGHLDFGETYEQCALREIREECGPDFKVRLVPSGGYDQFQWFVTNDYMPQDGKHYITIFMVADWVSGEAQNMEPDKCEGWEWLSFDDLKTQVENKAAAQWIPMHLLRFHRKKIGV